MDDWFSRLAARTLEADQSILKPIIAPRFAPSQRLDDIENFEIITQPDDSLIANGSLVRLDPSAASTLETRPPVLPQFAPPPANPSIVSHSNNTLLVTSSSTSEEIPTHPPEQVSIRRTPSPSLVPSPMPTRSLANLPDSSDIQATNPSPSQLPEQTVHTGISIEQVISTPIPTLVPRNHTVALMPELSAKLSQPQVRPVETVAEVSPPEAAVTDSPRTINITIGRIEIRATTQATSTAQPNSPHRPVSLPDYLRQRNGGGER